MRRGKEKWLPELPKQPLSLKPVPGWAPGVGPRCSAGPREAALATHYGALRRNASGPCGEDHFDAAVISFSAASRIDLPTCGPYFCIIEPQISWVALPWLAMNFWPVGDFRNVVRSFSSCVE